MNSVWPPSGIVRRSNREGSLPHRTPIDPTFALALELFTGLTQSSAAVRAHTIQNAGYHISQRPDRVIPLEVNTRLPNDRKHSAISNASSGALEGARISCGIG